MGRYTRGDDRWEITREGTTLTIVSNDTTTVETLPSAKLAETRERVLINAQARAGFKLYKAPVAVVEPAVAQPERLVYDARNPQLEQAILDDPENAAVYEVYGDWLQEQGDPRGKAIALERGTRGKPWGDKHHAALGRHVAAHRAYLHGSFTEGRGRSQRLRLGFVSHLELLTGAFGELPQLLREPASRFLTSIHLDAEGDAIADLAVALQVIAEHAPQTLRCLELGGDTALDDLDVLRPRLPALRTFAISNILDRELAVGSRCLRALVDSPWPRLQSLELELLRGDCAIDDVAPLFASALPKLTSLRFRTTFDHEIATVLVASPLAAQLEQLTFEAPGDDPDALAELLVATTPNLSRLVELAVPIQQFSEAARAALETVAKDLRDADGTSRYENSAE
jgi:uncharacterized protein (TIGR02996 family)